MRLTGGPAVIAALRTWGIDARLALFVPLATVASVLLTSLFWALLVAVADQSAFLAVLFFLAFGGMMSAILALPLSLPISLAAWALVFGLLHRRGLDDARTAAIAAVPAGLAGAIGFALWLPAEAARGLFLIILPGALAGAFFSSRLVYRSPPTGGLPA